MQSVFSRSRLGAAAWLLIIVLLAPSGFASDGPSDASLWAEFIAWFEAGFGTASGVIAADDAGFIVFMSRLIVPGG
jgi:hypothetical protein